jgi:hypothetical protein
MIINNKTMNAMKLKIFGGLLVAMLAITSIAEAQSSTPVINRRQHRQERRITMDARHDRITPMQAHRLRADERQITRERRFAMANGRVNRAERMHMRRQEKRINHTMRRDEHVDMRG